MKIIDISVALSAELPKWPGSPGLKHEFVSKIAKGDPANGSTLFTDIHLGTHVDAPLHFIEGAKSVESLDLSKLIGPARVVDCGGLKKIGAKDLETRLGSSFPSRLLLKTDNSALWSTHPGCFVKDFCALSLDGAQWLAQKKIDLIGIDYLSIQLYQDSFDTHRVLLSQEIVILEGIQLADVPEGEYQLYCLPLKLLGAEGAPARAILISDSP